jgi:hypothetical protein
VTAAKPRHDPTNGRLFALAGKIAAQVGNGTASLVREVQFKMPEKRTVRKARKYNRQGKASTMLAGALVHEKIEHIRKGKHGARSAKQANATGLSKTRKTGVKAKSPRKGTVSAKWHRTKNVHARGQHARRRTPSARPSRARRNVMKRVKRWSPSHRPLSRQAKRTARM